MIGLPLAGVRIVDFTHVWAGPLATRILGDLGAEVIKVEPPWGRGPAVPPGGAGVAASEQPVAEPWNRQAVFNKLNRNKQSLCVNLKEASGHELVSKLIAASDVVIDNFSARAMASMGFDWDTLTALNPNIIHITMPGYGVSGPYTDFVAYGPSVEPMCGLTSIMGYGQDEPRTTAMALPDAVAGVTAACAVLSALHRRETEGIGGHVELSLQEGAIAMFGEYFIHRQLTGEQPPRAGNAHRVHAPHGVYRCKGDDAWICIAVRNDDEWRALCELSAGTWHDDIRFSDPASRREHRAALDALIDAWTCHQDKLALMNALQTAGVAAGAILSAPEFMDDPHSKARGFFAQLGADHIEPKPYPGMPTHFDGERLAQHWVPAPKLGEHNAQVLGELLGMSAEQVASLEQQGIVATRPPS